MRFQTLGINLQQISSTTIVAIGMTLVIATGGIDLSVGSVMAIAGALAPLLFLHIGNPVLGVALALLLPLLAGAACGLFNGWLVARIKLQPIIATLILFTAGRGIAQVLTNGAGQPFTNPGFSWLGQGTFLGLPIQSYLMLLLLIIFSLFVHRASFGRYIQATGGNAEAARLAGVPVARTRIAVYIISGMLVCLAGVLLAAQTYAGNPNEAVGWELNAIAAVIVGGTLLTGGKGTVFGLLVGALLLGLIFNVLNFENGYGLISLSSYWQTVIHGAFLLVVVLLQMRLSNQKALLNKVVLNAPSAPLGSLPAPEVNRRRAAFSHGDERRVPFWRGEEEQRVGVFSS